MNVSSSERIEFAVLGLWDDAGREAHLFCEGRKNILQERLHQVLTTQNLLEIQLNTKENPSVIKSCGGEGFRQNSKEHLK